MNMDCFYDLVMKKYNNHYERYLSNRISFIRVVKILQSNDSLSYNTIMIETARSAIYGLFETAYIINRHMFE
jgi:hypothetical protein